MSLGAPELTALGAVAGLDQAALAALSREEKVAEISSRRDAVLRAAAQAAGVLGAEKEPTPAELAAALKKAGAWPDGAEAGRAATQEAVFTAILGDLTQATGPAVKARIAKLSDPELAVLAKAAGLETKLATMSKEKRVALICFPRFDKLINVGVSVLPKSTG